MASAPGPCTHAGRSYPVGLTGSFDDEGFCEFLDDPEMLAAARQAGVSVADVERLRPRLAAIASVAIVGAGQAGFQVAASLREATTYGCNVLHIHFRSRGPAELCDQIAAFSRDVAPLLN